MPYKPENDISENVIHRNSKYVKINDISCCTCSKCINQNFDATLKLFNFKPASPIVNTNSIGSNITFFSSYMIPDQNAEFNYIIDPVVTNKPSINVYEEGQDTNLAEYLIYFPFRNCTGVVGSGKEPPVNIPGYQNYNFAIIDPYGNVERNNFVQYDSKFVKSPYYAGFGSYFIYNQYQPYYLTDAFYHFEYDRPLGVAHLSNKNSNLYSSTVEYDPFYGSYWTKNQTVANTFNYPVKGFYCYPVPCTNVWRGFSSDYTYLGWSSWRSDLADLPFGSVIQDCENVTVQNDYPWATYGETEDFFWYYNGLGFGPNYLIFNNEYFTTSYTNDFYEYNYFYDYTGYPSQGVEPLLRKDNGVFPPIYSFPNSLRQFYNLNTGSIINSGPNANYYKYLSRGSVGGHFIDLSKYFMPPSWITPGNMPSNSFFPNCSEELLKTVYGEESDHPTIDPGEINIGNYGALTSYISSHDYSTYGFRINNSCENNINKVMDAKYVIDVSGFEFPYEHPNYFLKIIKHFVSNKFLTPTIGPNYFDACTYKWEKINTPYQWDQNVYNFTQTSSPSFLNLSGPTKFNGDPQMNEVYEPQFSHLAKGGYILKNFKYFKNGNFEIKIGAVDATPFVMTMDYGKESKLRTDTNGLREFFVYEPLQYSRCYSSVYTWELYPNISYPQGLTPEEYLELYKDSYAKSQKINNQIIYSTEFYSAASITYYFYYNNQNQIQEIWSNGVFADIPSNARPVFFEHYNTCGNQIYYEPQITVSDYVGIKGQNTYETSNTDSSGVTTTTIHNVLFIGKKLLEYQYENYSGNNRPLLSNKTKVPLNYMAYLNGGFECDFTITYRSIPMCKYDSIPDKFKRTESLKINLQNFSKITGYKTNQEDFANYYQSQNPYDPDVYSTYKSANFVFSDTVFSPPTKNPNAQFKVKKISDIGFKWQIVKTYNTVSQEFDKKFSTNVTAYNKRFTQNAMYGRMYGNDYSDDYKSSFYVKGTPEIWETGNKLKIYAPTPISAIFLSNKDYYCILVKEVTDPESSERYCQIRVAETYQKAINGEYIEIKDSNGKAIYAKLFNANISFEVTYKYNLKDNTKNYLPGYLDFYPQNYTINNPNLQKLGIPYTISNFRQSNSYGELTIATNFSSASSLQTGFFDPSAGQFGFAFVNSQNNAVLYGKDFDHIEVVSLSPIKIILKNYKFVINSTFEEFKFNFVRNNVSSTASGYFGFVCDVVIEEDVDEYTIPSLPDDFNRILNMVDEINTQQPYQAKERKQLFVIPEKCTHIGKVIDRKNCNCPKKWIRECEVFGTTDWNNCMRCDKFEYED